MYYEKNHITKYKEMCIAPIIMGAIVHWNLEVDGLPS